MVSRGIDELNETEFSAGSESRVTPSPRSKKGRLIDFPWDSARAQLIPSGYPNLSLSLSIPFQTPPERDWFTSAVNHEGDEKLVAILFFFLPRSNTNIEIYDVVYIYIYVYVCIFGIGNKLLE